MELAKEKQGSVQIVVVEDDSDDALMTMRALKKLNPPPTIKLVRDGREALDLLTGEDALVPELVFLDLKLPKVHGLEVLRLLRENEATRSIPVAVLTSSDDPKDIARATQFGANEYIRKPIDWEEYSQALCSAAEKYIKSSVCRA